MRKQSSFGQILFSTYEMGDKDGARTGPPINEKEGQDALDARGR